MLGSRTKQVFSYGKRSQRIVNVSEDRTRPKESDNIFDDSESIQCTPIVSRMKKRENVIPLKPRTPSPKVIRMNRRKRISPVRSAAKKLQRVAQIIDGEPPKRESLPTKSTAQASSSKVALDAAVIPSRIPFSHFPLNVPGSPAIPSGRSPLTKRTSLKRHNLKPFSPFVDMDIIILDESGRPVKQERRVSQTDIEVNSFGAGNTKSKRPLMPGKPSQPPHDLTDSDADYLEQPKKPKRSTRHVLTIYSDESESDDEASVPITHAPKTSESSFGHVKAGSLRIVDVAVPPAPYPIHVKAALKPSPSHLVTPQTLPQSTTSYQPPSPPLRPRQLTPIRGSRSRHIFEPSPVFTDLDLSLDFEELNLESPSHANTPCHAEPQYPAYLQPLLEECHQETCGPIEFSSFIDSFPFDPVVRSERVEHAGNIFKKIGEASYSEVFGIGDVVLKVIPLRDESGDGSTSKLKPNVKCNDSGEVEDGPAPSDARDVRKEMIVTRAMGEVCDGFVKLLKTYIVRGKYPEVLLRLWDEYHETKGSESVRPDTFLVSQVYAIIVLPNGGLDLEAYKFVNPSKTGWRQACSLFWQVAKALAHAEQLVSFEHRDLHWGQILVKNLPVPGPAPLKPQNRNQNQSKPWLTRLPMDDLAHGVRGTLIDLGLSRMDAGDGAGGERVHWTPFDDEVFMGEGDYQFDIYRIMREYNGGAWEDFNPLTNVMWLHYLGRKLLHSKRLKPPAVPRNARAPEAVQSSTAAFTEKDCYNCLVDIEAWLGDCIGALIPSSKPKAVTKGKGRRKTQAVKAEIRAGPSCAGEVVAYAVKKGWVQPTS